MGLYESVNLLRQPSLRGDDEFQAPEAHKHARDRVSSVASHPQPTEFDETHKTPLPGMLTFSVSYRRLVNLGLCIWLE